MPAGPGPVLSDAGHLVRTASTRPAVEIPPAYYAGRAFMGTDRDRWQGRGVEEAVLTRGSEVRAVLSGWIPVDSTAHFVLLRARTRP